MLVVWICSRKVGGFESENGCQASCAVGDDIRRAVKFASGAGALACTKFGSMEAMPKKAEIIQLLQREDIDILPRNP
jgi:hypothetical protein